VTRRDGWMDGRNTDGISGLSEQGQEVVLALIFDVCNSILTAVT